MELIELCRQFIAIDSTNSIGTFEVADFAGRICSQMGLEVELQKETLAGIEQANIIAKPRSQGNEKGLMLLTHLDTVDPGPYGLWVNTDANPFNASLHGNRMYGLGTADGKLDFVCKLLALEKICKANLKTPVFLVGTYGKEAGMNGALKLIRRKKLNPKWALVGEPTGNRIIRGAKGLAVVEIEIPFSDEEKAFQIRNNSGEGTSTQSRIFRGRAAHAAAPEMGESAITKMFEYFMRLPDGLAVMELEGGTQFNTIPANAVLEIDMIGGLKETIGHKLKRILRAINEVKTDFTNYQHKDGELNEGSTLNIGTIRTLEESVKMTGCCYFPPNVTNETYERWMFNLREACGEVDAQFTVLDYKQPYSLSEGAEIVRFCQEQLKTQGLDASCGKLAATNEANVLSRFGIESVVFGPGQSMGNSHTYEEHVTIDQMNDAIHFYHGVLERVCL